MKLFPASSTVVSLGMVLALVDPSLPILPYQLCEDIVCSSLQFEIVISLPGPPGRAGNQMTVVCESSCEPNIPFISPVVSYTVWVT